MLSIVHNNAAADGAAGGKRKRISLKTNSLVLYLNTLQYMYIYTYIHTKDTITKLKWFKFISDNAKLN